MIVVADSGPLIALAKIGKLNILHELFGEIVIPRAVWIEVVERGAGKPGSEDERTASWIRVAEVKDTLGVEVLEKEIERGEAEAIVLAKELGASLLLLDEKVPRIIAKSSALKSQEALRFSLWPRKREF